MKRIGLLLACVWAFFAVSVRAAAPDPADQRTQEILAKYLQATSGHEVADQAQSAEVEISASIPQLKKQGSLHALRKMSKLGQVTYRVLGFQGDSSVKREVIARYLEAEQQTRNHDSISLTPANYKFRLKGEKYLAGRDVYVLQVSPRKKQVGLFKGEVWLDANSYLPLYERGRLVKNPSIFFKRVEFERAYGVVNGTSVTQHLYSKIDTRLVGEVDLDVNYTNVASGEEAGF